MSTTRSWKAQGRILFGVLAVAVFVAYFCQVINLFYSTGAPPYDAGWFAYVLSRLDFPPDNPLYLQQRGIPSFFAFHVAPIMPLWGALSEALQLSPAAAFAAYQGFFHALLLLVGAALVRTPFRPPADMACRALVGLALAFSPLALSAISYVHHEMAMPILFLAACVAWSRGHGVLAAIAFLLTLFVRTDAGLHAATFLIAFAAAEWLVQRRRTPLATVAIAAGAVAFLYAVAAFATVYLFFPQFDNFRYSYSGNHFDHVSVEFVSQRLSVLLQKRPELFVIFLGTLAIGVRRRSLHVVAGAAAVLPWVALHMLAARDVSGELYTYKAFPFLVLLAWPLLVPALLRPRGPPPVTGARALLGWGATCLLATVAYFASPPGDAALREARANALGDFLPRVSLAEMRATDDFVAALARLRAQTPTRVYLDAAMMSLMPDTSRDDLVRPELGARAPQAGPFVLVYFGHAARRGGVEAGFAPAADACYAVAGTPLRLAARGIEASAILGLGARVAPTPCPRGS
jgi:hypothetical protein